METHKVKSIGFYEATPDYWRTFCGINDIKASEYMSESLVNEHEKCTCRRCNKAYKKYYEQKPNN